MSAKQGGVDALAAALQASRHPVSQERPRVDPIEPYCVATRTAPAELRNTMKRPGMQWWVPAPLNTTEQADLDTYLDRRGVQFPHATLFDKGDADRDVGPYIMAWRVERGDVLLTRHGLAQFGTKVPFVTQADAP
ncbi:hypothetical protein IHN32_16980 [Deinococcus sp. 14RED07]|uniref:hypothetical protein n=1 Tax=Deinococcus sp. 14RED07 TaxID=2745874 RepID=UPI001E3E8115|nr:hypothetical protein [Deinococcus sp. 14RED07]MCD0177634.1 hypothetical protein [Deinococcus sp. 14RED07]